MVFSTAKAFLEKGAKVVIVGRNVERGEKAAAELSKISAALSLAKDGIRVNTVNPGYVDTPLVSLEALGKELHDALVAMHPLGRFAKPEEIAHAIIFLAENDFITGTHLVVDGGYTAQ
ncbi:MAG: SDR family oxidoreductase [Butyrivibrio sp.]|nr:SDR family oxidoreductase [Butyrivibrio sp.]